MFEQWEAAIAAGATLTELMMWDNNEIPSWFKALVVAWYDKHILVDNHRQDAAAESAKRKQGRGK